MYSSCLSPCIYIKMHPLRKRQKMAEILADGEVLEGGLALPSADEVTIRAQNARRIARRKQAAALSGLISQTTAEDLSREGDTRVVGGRFESIQEIPEQVTTQTGLSLDDLLAFLETLNFDPRDITP